MDLFEFITDYARFKNDDFFSAMMILLTSKYDKLSYFAEFRR